MTDTSKKNDKKNIVLYVIIFSLILILVSILIYYYNVYSSPLKTFISMPVISQQQPRAPPPIQDIHRTAAAISALVI